MNIATLVEQTGMPVDDHLDLHNLVPVATTVTTQGDVLAQPTELDGDWQPIPRNGAPMVEGTHDHIVCGAGRWCRVENDDHIVALVECDEPVYLLHQEHGGQGLAAGRWEIRRQTEVTAAGRRAVMD